jgi:hypothetical protein
MQKLGGSELGGTVLVSISPSSGFRKRVRHHSPEPENRTHRRKRGSTGKTRCIGWAHLRRMPEWREDKGCLGCLCPAGAAGLSPAFQRREHPIKDFALKGRKIGGRYRGRILYEISVSLVPASAWGEIPGAKTPG